MNNHTWHKIDTEGMVLSEELPDVLPESGERILIFNAGNVRYWCDRGIFLGYLWRGDNFRDHNDNGMYLSWQPLYDEEVRHWNPAYWMPLPEPPEEFVP